MMSLSLRVRPTRALTAKLNAARGRVPATQSRQARLKTFVPWLTYWACRYNAPRQRHRDAGRAADADISFNMLESQAVGVSV